MPDDYLKEEDRIFEAIAAYCHLENPKVAALLREFNINEQKL